MEAQEKITLTVETSINAPLSKVWDCWNGPEHITQWNSASPDWHTPRATNDLRVGGKILSRMEARDGSMGFDFEGTYHTVVNHQEIGYVIADGRNVQILFSNEKGTTKVLERFEAESENPIEMQQGGWQSIMNSFKKYVEELA